MLRPSLILIKNLYTGTSDSALRCVLSQLDENNCLHPAAFISRKLKDPETTERELLAGARFQCIWLKYTYIYTYHAPFTQMLKIQDPSLHMEKWICTLDQILLSLLNLLKAVIIVSPIFLSRYVNNNEISENISN